MLPFFSYTQQNLTAYSPYGLPLSDWQGEERYLYGGKELDRTDGLLLYDFHARQYDPQLGRFTTQDPMQGQSLSLSSYLYCSANPICRLDPSGMRDFYDTSGKYLYSDDIESATHFMIVGKKEDGITNEEKYRAAVARGEFFPVAKGMAERIKEIEKSTASDNLERGFFINQDGTMSDIVVGENGKIDDSSWRQIASGENNIQNAQTDIHTHPLDAGDGNYGLPNPSHEDIKNSRDRINIVIGYKREEYRDPYRSSVQVGGTKEYILTPQVGFYTW